MKNIHTKSLFVVLFAVLFAFGPSMAEAKFSLSTKNTAAAFSFSIYLTKI
jgi:hypothetical protein